jgi:uncharacterized protein YaaN involved in tellurite resistance
MNETPTQSLLVTDAVQLKQELQVKSAQPTAPQDELDARAEQFVADLLNYDPKQPEQKEARKTSVENMASDTLTKAAKMSEMLRAPIASLANRGSNDGNVGNALVQLKMKVEELDPAKFEFSPGWFSRVLGKLPGVGDPLKRYFTKYESAQTVIKAIVNSLENGRDQLLRDSATMFDDQKEMWDAVAKLDRAVQLGKLIDKKLVEQTASLTDEERKKFINEELLFPLRQRTIDLQQQFAVNQQGILAMELIIRNNKELVRGVNRALNVTMSALQVGVTVALALEKQKDVLEKVTSVSDTTSNLIASTSARLKTQGVEIQKQASSATLSLDSLRSAFADLNSAIDDISQFRAAALPQMAKTVIELDTISAHAKSTLSRVSQANIEQPKLKIELD